MVNKDLIAASATPLVLSILQRGESYGYAIIQDVHALSQEQIKWTDGMLYPILHRLEKEKLIESRWQKSENGRNRKYYYIKANGKKKLKDYQNQWKIVTNTLNNVWEDKLCLA